MSADQDRPSSRRGTFSALVTLVHVCLVVGAVGLAVYAASPLLHQLPAPATQPSTMEEVDWHGADSSIYCLACHKEVAPAMAGLDVQQGHSHNVVLTLEQIKAAQQMGTIVGPDGLLICMSCHVLGSKNQNMLADTLTDSKLCKHCHPEQFTMIGTKHDLRTTAPHEKNRFGQTAETGGPCSACHLSHHYAREFEPSPLDPDGRCITCHKIGRAAAELARPTMEHPDAHCVVCHNPHNPKNEHFLKKPAAHMCADCHKDFEGGPTYGMHPLGQMRYDVPQSLIDAGAQVFKNRRQLTCVVCHSTHSSTHKPLLIMPADTNQLCLACHENELARLAPNGKMPLHSQSPKLTAEQRAVVERRNGRVGPNGELLCVSCHKVHHAQADTDLLNFQPASNDGCNACHKDQAEVIGTRHDLRISAPTEKNLAGQTPGEAGACSACHMAHGPGRATSPQGADLTGQCTTCHQANGCAKSELGGNVGHPGANCTACHNPHQASTAEFLSKNAGELCRNCHAEKYSLTGGPHDSAAKADAWKQIKSDKLKDQPAASGSCLPCHSAHGKKGSGLSRLAPAGGHDAACLACHEDAAWNAPTDIAAIHPRKIAPDEKLVPLALVPTNDAGEMQMGCRTCHNPHGGANPVHLARVKADEPTSDLCTHCHADRALIEKTGHASARLAKIGFDVDSCKPCHAMHAKPSDSWGLMLSPRFLRTKDESSAANPQSQPADAASPEAAVPCLVCHHANGPAPVRQVSTHPPVSLANYLPPDAPGYMPLFNFDGKPDAHGQITCRTCHLSHGQTSLLTAAATNPAINADESRSARMQLRPFVAPNLCTQCHGEKARLKFLFFHNLEQRSKQ